MDKPRIRNLILSSDLLKLKVVTLSKDIKTGYISVDTQILTEQLAKKTIISVTENGIFVLTKKIKINGNKVIVVIGKTDIIMINDNYKELEDLLFDRSR